MRVTDLEVDNIIQQEHRTSTGAWLPRGMCVNWNELRYLIVLSLRYGEYIVVTGVAMRLKALYLIFSICDQERMSRLRRLMRS